MGRYHFCYTFLFLVQFSNGAVEVYETGEIKEIHMCVANLIQRIELVNATDVTLINVNASLAKELQSLLAHPVRFISRSFYWPNDTLFNDVYVIQCTDFFMFSQGLDLVKRDPFWNPRAKFVIIIEYIEEYIEDVSHFLIHNHIYDVAVVTTDEHNHIVVYTFGLEHDECDRPATKLLQLFAHCSEIHKVEKIYVTTRKTSLRGCHVKFVSHNYWPFVSFNGTAAIEQFILSLIHQFENITVEVVNFGKVEHFGSRLDNFTYTGMLHEIELYNVEGAMGGYILTLNRMTILDFIDPYMVDYYKIVIARARTLGKWDAVLKQLGLRTLCIILGTFLFICVIVVLMDIFTQPVKDRSRDVLIVWGYFFNNIAQTNKMKTGLPYRLVILNTLLYVFILSYAIQASLLSATTKPIRDYQLDEVDDVITSYQPIMSPNLYAYLQYNPVVNLLNCEKTCKVTLDCIMRVMTEDEKPLFTIASDIYHQSYSWKFCDKYGELKIYTLKESIGTLLQTMYIRRGSSLAAPFNRLLLRARSGGFIDKFVDRMNYQQKIKHRFVTRKVDKKPQSLWGLRGVFWLLACGCFMSFILFLFEYFQNR